VSDGRPRRFNDQPEAYADSGCTWSEWKAQMVSAGAPSRWESPDVSRQGTAHLEIGQVNLDIRATPTASLLLSTGDEDWCAADVRGSERPLFVVHNQIGRALAFQREIRCNERGPHSSRWSSRSPRLPRATPNFAKRHLRRPVDPASGFGLFGPGKLNHEGPTPLITKPNYCF